ncbi:unnamed protein product [Amoebophrya sp. A120]|nr:unnamed protein product [Amoebophrya sp. A120]|eukprot:GSA120T00001501001.1
MEQGSVARSASSGSLLGRKLPSPRRRVVRTPAAAGNDHADQPAFRAARNNGSPSTPSAGLLEQHNHEEGESKADVLAEIQRMRQELAMIALRKRRIKSDSVLSSGGTSTGNEVSSRSCALQQLQRRRTASQQSFGSTSTNGILRKATSPPRENKAAHVLFDDEAAIVRTFLDTPTKMGTSYKNHEGPRARSSNSPSEGFPRLHEKQRRIVSNSTVVSTQVPAESPWQREHDAGAITPLENNTPVDENFYDRQNFSYNPPRRDAFSSTSHAVLPTSTASSRGSTSSRRHHYNSRLRGDGRRPPSGMQVHRPASSSSQSYQRLPPPVLVERHERRRSAFLPGRKENADDPDQVAGSDAVEEDPDEPHRTKSASLFQRLKELEHRNLVLQKEQQATLIDLQSAALQSCLTPNKTGNSGANPESAMMFSHGASDHDAAAISTGEAQAQAEHMQRAQAFDPQEQEPCQKPAGESRFPTVFDHADPARLGTTVDDDVIKVIYTEEEFFRPLSERLTGAAPSVAAAARTTFLPSPSTTTSTAEPSKSLAPVGSVATAETREEPQGNHLGGVIDRIEALVNRLQNKKSGLVRVQSCEEVERVKPVPMREPSPVTTACFAPAGRMISLDEGSCGRQEGQEQSPEMKQPCGGHDDEPDDLLGLINDESTFIVDQMGAAAAGQPPGNEREDVGLDDHLQEQVDPTRTPAHVEMMPPGNKPAAAVASRGKSPPPGNKTKNPFVGIAQANYATTQTDNNRGKQEQLQNSRGKAERPEEEPPLLRGPFSFSSSRSSGEGVLPESSGHQHANPNTSNMLINETDLFDLTATISNSQLNLVDVNEPSGVVNSEGARASFCSFRPGGAGPGVPGDRRATAEVQRAQDPLREVAVGHQDAATGARRTAARMAEQEIQHQAPVVPTPQRTAIPDQGVLEQQHDFPDGSFAPDPSEQTVQRNKNPQAPAADEPPPGTTDRSFVQQGDADNHQARGRTRTTSSNMLSPTTSRRLQTRPLSCPQLRSPGFRENMQTLASKGLTPPPGVGPVIVKTEPSIVSLGGAAGASTTTATSEAVLHRHMTVNYDQMSNSIGTTEAAKAAMHQATVQQRTPSCPVVQYASVLPSCVEQMRLLVPKPQTPSLVPSPTPQRVFPAAVPERSLLSGPSAPNLPQLDRAVSLPRFSSPPAHSTQLVEAVPSTTTRQIIRQASRPQAPEQHEQKTIVLSYFPPAPGRDDELQKQARKINTAAKSSSSQSAKQDWAAVANLRSGGTNSKPVRATNRDVEKMVKMKIKVWQPESSPSGCSGSLSPRRRALECGNMGILRSPKSSTRHITSSSPFGPAASAGSAAAEASSSCTRKICTLSPLVGKEVVTSAGTSRRSTPVQRPSRFSSPASQPVKPQANTTNGIEIRDQPPHVEKKEENNMSSGSARGPAVSMAERAKSRVLARSNSTASLHGPVSFSNRPVSHAATPTAQNRQRGGGTNVEECSFSESLRWDDQRKIYHLVENN